MSSKLVLIDGHSILNRAFYGVPLLTNAEGLHTNGIYGFLNILFKILEEEKPNYLCVAFDVKEPTFRHKMYAEYKGTRKPMPQELREQVGVLQDVLAAMQIKVVKKGGYEADDILGTLAKQAEKEGTEVTLVSGDRDLLQIASDHIKIRIPKTKGGRTETEDYHAEDVLEKYQVTPLQFIELKALMGDASDNIPGVPKVGEKTAIGLMVSYGSIEGIYEHIDEITKKSIKESLIENRELADLSKALATIKTDCELDVTFADMAIRNFYTKEAYSLFQKLEFKNFLTRFSDENAEDNKVDCRFTKITDLVQCEQVFTKAKEAKEAGCILLKDDDKSDSFAGMALCFSKEESFVFIPEGFLTQTYLVEKVKELASEVNLITFYAKDIYACIGLDAFTKGDALAENKNIIDLKVAAYLLNPIKNDYFIEDLAREYLDMQIKEPEQFFGKLTLAKAAEEKTEEFVVYGATLAYVLYSAKAFVLDKVKELGMDKLFWDVEMPLSKVLYDMETLGVLVDKEELVRYGESLVSRIDELQKAVYEAAGVTFNLNSPKQLGEVLFEKLQLPGSKKTKSGYSTAADVLEKLAPEYPIVADILEYRTLAKLKSTYADGLVQCVAEDGRIHTTFQQTITATGRISSTEPNLQNIPMRMELGRRIRKAFVPKKGYVFMDADYSQIELRLLAHMSGDEQLIEAYKQDADIHRITASKVFHTPLNEVTDLQRRNAKAVNFGIVYGISSFGLSQDLSINRKEAEGYIQAYFEQYPKVKEFLDTTVENAGKDGYVTTMFARRRPLPEILSSNFMQRSFGKRVAMNAPIQGSAADIMKIAMIRVWEELRRQNLESRILIQVHDELLLEVKETEVEMVQAILINGMKNAVDLSVAMEVDVHCGSDWYEAK